MSRSISGGHSVKPQEEGEVTALREIMKEKDVRIGQLSRAIAATE